MSTDVKISQPPSRVCTKFYFGPRKLEGDLMYHGEFTSRGIYYSIT